MRKYTKKELREYVRLSLARDLTTIEPENLPTHFEKIGYSSGVYGLSGCLIFDTVTGEYGAVLARSSNLFRIM